MAYNTNNPPEVIGQSSPTPGYTMWRYISNDPHGTVNTAGYFSNGALLGMKVRDIVIVTEGDQRNRTTTIHVVLSVDGNSVDVGNSIFTPIAQDSD